MKQKFVFNIVFLLLVNLIIKPLWVLGIDRGVQVVVGAQQYGRYFALLNLSIIFNILLDVGLTNHHQRQVAADSRYYVLHFFPVTILKIMLGLLYVIVVYVMASFSGLSADEKILLLILLVNQFLLSFLLFLRANISGLQYFFSDSIFSVMDKTFMILFCGIILWTSWFPVSINLMLFSLMQTAAYLLTIVVALGYLLWRSRPQFIMPTFRDFFRIAHSTLPFSLLVLMMSIYYRIDSVMLKYMLPDGAEQAGIYAQGFRLLDAGSMLGALFAGLLIPMFAYQLSARQEVFSLFLLSANVMVFINTAIILGIFLSLYPLVTLLYKQHIRETVDILCWLMPAMWLVNLTYIMGAFLTAAGKLKELNSIALLGVISNVLLNMWWIPLKKAEGAAMTSMITQIMVLLLHGKVIFTEQIVLYREYIRKNIVFILLSVLIGVGLINLSWPLIIKLSISLCALFLIGIYTGHVSIPEWRKYLQQLKQKGFFT